MPTITINGVACAFDKGEMIIDIANRCGVEIPQYCYHEGLSAPAQCRICLAEVHAPNPRNDNAVEPMMGGKLMPTCATQAGDGMVVYTTSPKAVANQKSVMEYLLINHPLDCPVCDQAGECSLQDYSYRYGRGVSRFEETKKKQPKKNLGPDVNIYSDRCILCTRCVRFCREVPQTGELMIDGRGNDSQIDVFPGTPLDNPLAGNVVDLCPVGALLDKDFLFQQRVWLLKSTPIIDGVTASGDNAWADHNHGRIYRLRARTNMKINTWWITDEVRHSWKFVHSDDRIAEPMRRTHGVLESCGWSAAYQAALEGMRASVDGGQRLCLVVSPMLTTEEAWALGTLARSIDPDAVLAVGPVPVHGENQKLPNPRAGRDFTIYAEKAPNARGVRRALEAIGGEVLDFDGVLDRLGRSSGHSDVGAVLLTGGYPSAWATDEFVRTLEGKFVVLIDLLSSRLTDAATVVLPGASWLEKHGSFENIVGQVQAFEPAIPTQHRSKAEGQIATDLTALLDGGQLATPSGGYADFIVDEGPGQVPGATAVASIERAEPFDAAATRQAMAGAHERLCSYVEKLIEPPTDDGTPSPTPDMQMVEL